MGIACDMGMVDYVRRSGDRDRLMSGDIPRWMSNNKRGVYIISVVLSAPPWVDRWELMAMKAFAAAMTRFTGRLHVCDHIVPLNHPRVCGLTVPWNLRVVPWRVNASKSNKWDPDQLELFN